jgi:hypothetical protein
VLPMAASADYVLFSDNFNVSAQDPDVNFEYNAAGRQGGTVAPVTYTQMEYTAWRTMLGGTSGSYAPGALGHLLSGENIYASPVGSRDAADELLYNFDSYYPQFKNIEISVDIDPLNENSVIPGGYNPVGQEWSALKFGVNYHSNMSMGQGFVIKLYDGGFWQAYWCLDDNNWGSGNVGNKTGFYNVKARFTETGPGKGLVNVFIDNVNVWNYTINSGWNNNLVYLQSGSAAPEGSSQVLVHAFDNLTVKAVPEPGSMLALASGIMGLGGLVIRKRR